jgi:uncharacterized protein
MKIITSIVPTLLTVLLIVLHPVLAAEPAEEDKRGTISVTGIASEYYPPDIVTITLSIETISKTASDSVAQNSMRAEKVVSKLKTLVDLSSGDSVKTSSYSVRPVYEYDNVKKRNVLTGYRVINQVTVRTKKIETVGVLIDKAIEMGANQVQGITFTLTDEKDYCGSVLKRATERAEREATVVAQSLHVKIAGIKHVAPACRKEARYPVHREMLTEAKAAETPETPIESGDIAIYGTVNVVFFINKE